MNKKVLISAGLVVLVAIGLFVTQERPNVGKPNVESPSGISVAADSVNQTDLLITSGPQSIAAVVRAGEPVPSHDEAAPEWTQEELSEPVKVLLGLSGKEHNYPELLPAIGLLSKDISAADVAALREMLTYPNDRFPGKMRDIEINSIKNDVLDRLLRQEVLSEGLGLQMAEMASDASNDSVWCDYCVQFMAPFYDRKAKDVRGEGQSVDYSSNEELKVIHDALFVALDERSETIAGTSLIGLELLSRTHEEFDRDLILEKAVEIAADESASASCRMTALKLAAMNEVKGDVVDTARLLAQTGETVLLRSAAIVTLGEIGEPEDRELINSFQLEGDRQIVAAVGMALTKLDAR